MWLQLPMMSRGIIDPINLRGRDLPFVDRICRVRLQVNPKSRTLNPKLGPKLRSPIPNL